MNITLTPKISQFGPQKAQNDPDLGQQQKLELKEAQKIKVFSFITRPQNSFENYPGPKIHHYGPKKPNDSEIKSKSNVTIEKNIAHLVPENS